MKIQMWSDFRCPFCYVGKRNLEEALKQSGINAEVEMMSFELDPYNKAQKDKSIHEILAQKYSTTVEKAKEMNGQVAARAKEVGLNYDMDSVIDANTFKAHKILQLAKEKGVAKQFSTLAMSAYFEKGQDLEDNQVLLALAKEVGLEEQDVLNAAESDEYGLKVRQDQQWASSIGVRGVPHFVFDNKVSLSGAQPIETFVEAMKYTQNLSVKEFGASKDVCEDDSCNI